MPFCVYSLIALFGFSQTLRSIECPVQRQAVTLEDILILCIVNEFESNLEGFGLGSGDASRQYTRRYEIIAGCVLQILQGDFGQHMAGKRPAGVRTVEKFDFEVISKILAGIISLRISYGVAGSQREELDIQSAVIGQGERAYGVITRFQIGQGNRCIEGRAELQRTCREGCRAGCCGAEVSEGAPSD